MSVTTIYIHLYAFILYLYYRFISYICIYKVRNYHPVKSITNVIPYEKIRNYMGFCNFSNYPIFYPILYIVYLKL